MTITELHWEIKHKVNKLDSNFHKDLVPAELDRILNYSVIPDFVEIVATGNNYKKYKLPFESTIQRIDMVGNLIVKATEQPPLTPVYDSIIQSYECKLSQLDYNYKHFVRAFILTDCGRINIVRSQLVENQELDLLLLDKTRRPSKKWKRVLCTIGKSSTEDLKSLYIYTNGEITTEEVYIEYIKQPKLVFFGGYNTLEYISSGTGYQSTDPPVDSDIDANYHGVLADMAAQLILGLLGDQNSVNNLENKLNNTL